MNASTKPSSIRGYLIAFVGTVIWSSTAIFIGYLTARFHMPPLVLAFWRDFIVAGTLFGVLALVARPLLHLGHRDVSFFVLYGFVLSVLNALWTVSVALNGASVATVLIYSSPVFTALAGWRWWGERLDALKIGAVVLSVVGCTFASGAYDRAVWQVNPVDTIVGLVSGVMFAAYSLLGKASSRRGVNPWTATLYSFVFGAAFLLLLQRPDTFFWLSRPLAAGPGGWREAALGWGVMVLLGVGPSIGGYGLYTVSLTYLPAATANLIVTLEPAMTAVLAFFFLGERLTVPQLLGGGLILIGVVLVRFSERASTVADTPPQPSQHPPTSPPPRPGPPVQVHDWGLVFRGQSGCNGRQEERAMAGETVLVVDDEAHIVELAALYLEQEGFRVQSAGDGVRALEMIARQPPALMVLDLMLPGVDGWEVCRRVRSGKAAPDLPIIMLTARDDDVDKIVGLELGADDYVTKPFNPRELVARVKSILRRTRRATHTEVPVHVGDVTVDPARHEVTIAGQRVELRPKEFDLLLTLTEHRGIVLSREQLLNLVWGYDFYGETRTVDVHIAHLRKKLTGSSVEIETVVSVGYKLVSS